jgi:hypothetical protein
MEEDLRVGTGVDELEQLALDRLDQRPVGRRREQRPVLAAEIVRLRDHVHQAVEQRQHASPVRELDLEYPLHQPAGERRVRGKVHVPSSPRS